MEEVLLRFPHIGHQIFEQLNNSFLTNCREVSNSWKNFIDNERLPWTRIIVHYIKPLKSSWRKFLQKSNIRSLFEMATLVIQHYKKFKRKYKDWYHFINLIQGDAADHPDSELDSGISVNGNYDQIEPSNRNGGQVRHFNGLQNYERIEELHGKIQIYFATWYCLSWYYLCSIFMGVSSIFFYQFNRWTVRSASYEQSSASSTSTKEKSVDNNSSIKSLLSRKLFWLVWTNHWKRNNGPTVIKVNFQILMKSMYSIVF